MFDGNMTFRDGDEVYCLDMFVHGTTPLLPTFKFWMAEVARDMLRLGVYFDALVVMLQVPGSAAYGWYDDDDDKIPDLLKEWDRETVMDGLAACLDKLGAIHLMKQIPGWDTDERDDPPLEWRHVIDEVSEEKNGLLNLIAACLDKLLTVPGMAEIDKAREFPWWHRVVPPKERESKDDDKEDESKHDDKEP